MDQDVLILLIIDGSDRSEAGICSAGQVVDKELDVKG
jgi:hypothetical protein